MKKSKKSTIKYLMLTQIVGLIILAFVICGISIHKNNINKKFDDAKYITYTVKQFDTLWDIAEEHNEFEVTTRQYVSKIFEMNNLKTDVLQIGQCLILIVPNN